MMNKWVKISVSALFAIAVIVLMFRTNFAQNSLIMEAPIILIKVDGESVFLTEGELRTQLQNKGLIFKDQTFEEVDIHKIERYINAISVVKSSKVYTEIGNKWTIEVQIRKPIARIFNNFKESFYLDSEGNTMVSPIHTARVVVVTGNILDRKNSESVPEIINKPALKSIRKLDDIYRISTYVCNDPFLHAQIAQIHRDKKGDFILTPQVGGHKIVFGTARTDEEVKEKFKKLKIFYKEAIPYEGWNKYKVISLKFNKQIVCERTDGGR